MVGNTCSHDLRILGWLFPNPFFGPFDLSVPKIWVGLYHVLVAFIFGPLVIMMFNIAVLLYSPGFAFDRFYEITGFPSFLVSFFTIPLAFWIGFRKPQRKRPDQIVRGVLFALAAFYITPILTALFVGILGG